MSKSHIVVFSGGSAANNLVDVFGQLAGDDGCSLSYVIPISDNGGSTSELIRVFGGPGIGDVRSRLVRLIPSSNSAEVKAIKAFFNHRLSSSPAHAKAEWHSLLEPQHPLWTDISSEKRELIRSFLTTINLEIVKRLRPTSAFNFQSASVGNLFLTGARLFTGSFESAIYLLGAITGVPSNVNVIPAINSNFSHHISAGLEDGTVITGQNAISHPSAPSAPTPVHESSTPSNDPNPTSNSHPTRTSLDLYTHDTIEDANLPGSLPTLRKQNITFAKSHNADLPSRISRIWYINPYGQEIRPAPNPKVLDCINDAGTVIYSIGSLYTSIIPCLILREVGERIARGGVKYKILILNGSLDRETRATPPSPSTSSAPSLSSNGTTTTTNATTTGGSGTTLKFTAKDFIAAIASALLSSRSPSSTALGTSIQAPESSYKDYVTHLIHLQGDSTPLVEREELSNLGIECIRIYGRRKEPDDGDGGMLYDGTALGMALETIIGGGKRGRNGNGNGVSRRNTLGIMEYA